MQPLYYSTMRGKREKNIGAGFSPPSTAVQQLHYSGMRGKKRGDEEEAAVLQSLVLGPFWAAVNFDGAVAGSGKRGGLQALHYGGGRGKQAGEGGEEEDGRGFPRMVRGDGYPYNQWREWN